MKKKLKIHENLVHDLRKGVFRMKNPEIWSPDNETSINPEKSNGISYIKLFRYSTTKEKTMILLGLLCSVGTGLCTTLYILLFGKLAGDMVNYVQESRNITANIDKDTFKTQLFDSVTNFAMLNSVLGFFMLSLSFSAIALFNYTSINQVHKIRILYYKKLLYQDISWFDRHSTGDFASRMTNDLNSLEDGLGEKVAMFVQFQVSCISGLIVAFVKGWELALICLAVLPVITLSVFVITTITSKISKSEMDAYASAGIIAEEVLSLIKTVVAFGGERKEVQRYTQELQYAKENNTKRCLLGGIGFGALWFFIFSSFALSFWYGVNMILKERNYPEEKRVYNPSTMITIFFNVMTSSINFARSYVYVDAFRLAHRAGMTIFSVINTQPVINSIKEEGKTIENLQGEIVFSNVHFEYPSRRNVKVLRDVNLRIKAGETVALVGASGCGKSTLIQLIQRFYDPDTGKIVLDGQDIKDLNLKWLRSNIGVVGQEPILFGTTITENIKMGDPTASQEEIEAAAKKANAHSFITSLPKGYDTFLGERGAQLSGGQKQRIAIARALLRKPKILLLDEATSALDSNTEVQVQEVVNRIENCTTVIVAHRLSTVRNADKIIVLVDGRVQEEGTHDELIKSEGAYYNLVRTQISPVLQQEVHSDQSVMKLENEEQDMHAFSSKSTDLPEKNDTEKSPPISLFEIIKLSKPEKWYILIGCITAIITGATMPMYALTFGNILGILATGEENTVKTEAITYCMLLISAGIIIGTSTFFQTYMLGIAGEKLTMRLRSSMFASMLKQEIGWFDEKENSVGSLCARLSGEAAQVKSATGQCIGTTLESLSTLCISIALAMYFDYRLAFVALIFTPLIVAFTFFEQRFSVVLIKSRQKSLEGSTKIAVESLGNIRTVASLGCEETLLDLYARMLTPYRESSRKNIYIRAALLGLARSIGFFSFATCIYYGGNLIINHDVKFQNVLKASQVLIIGTSKIADSLAYTPNIQRSIYAARNIFNMLKRESKIQGGTHTIESNLEKENLEFCKTTFAYPTRRSTIILKEFDYKIKKGQTVALVGPSGCGKSTLLQLILRYYDPIEGEIKLNEENLKMYRLNDVRAYTKVVAQEPNLFNISIRDNITYGIDDNEIDQNDVIEAAKKANIHNFITALPLDYDTVLGERGMQLSGGQKQRIAIARALVRNPKLLILDEATSALDAQSEKVVQNALNEAKKGRTCIIIAHRLATIKDADIILVIDNGRICEKGTHANLLNLEGLYHNLYQLQNTKDKTV